MNEAEKIKPFSLQYLQATQDRDLTHGGREHVTTQQRQMLTLCFAQPDPSIAGERENRSPHRS
jgi:hypothetical protein